MQVVAKLEETGRECVWTEKSQRMCTMEVIVAAGGGAEMLGRLTRVCLLYTSDAADDTCVV